ncbi:SOS response-associated peptidase [Aquimarina sp. ERC-38]|uniref:SOS response-associated peptidase family protein n=1 Tax=Aquimarina sp. ERC-38 TaxID=2949996 RepID=UPI00224799A6|nr:SOS response-associated peptidase family protein [Aquimarina sp. ERC-38]UZO81495.1 SOS response-associated peptidase [Aquimarina sp. ERC-38]
MASYHLKLSNTRERAEIEDHFNLNFKFPNTYFKEVVIDGANENLLPIIKANSTDYISLGIWGLLPDDFEGDWQDFQKFFSTLFVKPRGAESEKLADLLNNDQPCLVIISGFFIHKYIDGELQPYYVYKEDEKPFCVAGICTTLEDGFVTFSIYNVPSTGLVENIQNMSAKMPLVVEKENYAEWLAGDTEKYLQRHLKDSNQNLKAHAITRQFFNSDIYFESMLEPVSNSNLQE